jgi:hypothetical protein
MYGNRVVLEVHNTLKNLLTLRVGTRHKFIRAEKPNMLALYMLLCFPGLAEAEGS